MKSTPYIQRAGEKWAPMNRWLLVGLWLSVVALSQAHAAQGPRGGGSGAVEPKRETLASPACCVITAINARAGFVAARESATGRIFQFKVDDPKLLRGLKAGQAVNADFQAQLAWVPPAPNRYRIVSIQTPAPGVTGGVKAPPVGPVSSTGVSPVVVPACSSATTTSAVFLKIDGIEGESQDLCHKGEIELLSVQTGGGASSIPVSNFTVAKRIDKASPKLFVAVASGEHHARATITILSSGGAQPQWLVYTLTDVLVTSLSQSVGLETREEVVLNARKLETKIQAASVSLQPSPSTSAVDIFLKLDGIPGDSQDPVHKGEIVVLSFKDGVQITAASSTSGGTAGKARFLDFVIDKNIDAASPNLLTTYQSGKHIKGAVITLRRKSGADLLVYRLSDGLITAYSQVAGATQRERVSLNFAKIELLLGTGPSGPGSRGGWDLKGNKRI